MKLWFNKKDTINLFKLIVSILAILIMCSPLFGLAWCFMAIFAYFLGWALTVKIFIGIIVCIVIVYYGLCFMSEPVEKEGEKKNG